MLDRGYGYYKSWFLFGHAINHTWVYVLCAASNCALLELVVGKGCRDVFEMYMVHAQ